MARKEQPLVGWHKHMKGERFLAEVFSDQPWLLATIGGQLGRVRWASTGTA